MPRQMTLRRLFVLALVALLVIATGLMWSVGTGSAGQRQAPPPTTPSAKDCPAATGHSATPNWTGFGGGATFSVNVRQSQQCPHEPTSDPTPTPFPSPISGSTHGVPTVNAAFTATVCRAVTAGMGAAAAAVGGMTSVTGMATGGIAAAVACGPRGSPSASQPPPAPTPEQVAYEAYVNLPVSAPPPYTAPPANTRTFVGFRTWLWIPNSSWHAVTKTASDGHVSTTVTATPVSVSWIMGDGTTEHCNGPGTPFIVGVTDPKVTKPSCSHVYTHDSHNQPGDHYTVTAVVQYAATWTTNIGPGGQFPPVELQAQTHLRVNQLQAVLD